MARASSIVSFLKLPNGSPLFSFSVGTIFVHVELGKRGGHAQRREERARLVDGRQRICLHIASGDQAEHLVSIESEARRILAMDVFHPGGEHYRQAGAVGDGGVQRGQLVLQPVGGPVLVTAHARQALMT